ncbi:hypothetical protein T03_1606 [Trichinella britovi]|uniref:Uncharacterized protein n=1 Tax=Trichinella britovi TaxID=45882 RepID=A0A0V1CG69_TRIBR|nr:hypothetical protein T03_1606 [Trichinella britovi]
MHGARTVTLLTLCSQAERQFGSLAAFVRVDGAEQHAAGVVQVDNNTSLKIRKHRIPVRNGHVHEPCTVDLNLHIYCRRTAVLDFYTVQLGTYSSDPRFVFLNRSTKIWLTNTARVSGVVVDRVNLPFTIVHLYVLQSRQLQMTMMRYPVTIFQSQPSQFVRIPLVRFVQGNANV